MLIFLNGGLGNQIGNYVFGKYLEFSRGLTVKFISSSNDDRLFMLDNFNVDFEFASLLDIEEFLSAKTNPRLVSNLLLNNAFNKKWRNNFWVFLNRIRDEYNVSPKKSLSLFSKVVVSSEVLNLNFPHLATGDRYSPIPEFNDKNFKSKMKKDLTLKTPLTQENLEIMDKIASSKNSIGIHIRRGDFLKFGFPVVKRKFLIEKINFFKENFDDPEFFVFSNDIPWAHIALNGQNVNIISINDESKGFFDFALLQNCRHRIYSNSTFSLWLRYLNPYEDKTEFYPASNDLTL